MRRNLRDGMISENTARDVFGVVLKDDLERTLDVKATEKQREELRTEERPMIDPVVPGAGNWMKENMRPGDRYIEAPTIAEHFQDAKDA